MQRFFLQAVNLKNDIEYIFSDDEIRDELKSLLRSLNALDLFETLDNEAITVGYLNETDIGISDLIMIGIPSGRAHQFHRDLQTHKSLRQKFQDVQCIEIFDKLLKEGQIPGDLISINQDVLKTIGFTFPERRELLDKLKSTKATNYKVQGKLYSELK